MFSVKKAIIIMCGFLLIAGAGFLLKKFESKKDFNKLISTIDLNHLEGTFLVIREYDNNIEYEIDEKRFNIELAIYLDTKNPNLNYQYVLSEDNNQYIITVTYKLYSNKVTKRYFLKLANK